MTEPERGETTKGAVTRILFSNEESGWCALRLRAEDGGSFAATGPLLGVRVGDDLQLTGRWIEHPRFGLQFETASYVQVAPTTLDGIRQFLGSGRIRGLGPKMAARVVHAFGLDTLRVLDDEPQRLLEVRGIAATTLARIRASWEKHRGIQQIMVFLTGHGVAPGVAVKAFRRYGAAAVDVVRSNPYRLADEVFGVGFRTADRVAGRLGMPADAPERMEAGLAFALREAAGSGHTFLPRNELLAAAAELLSLDAQDLEDALDRLTLRSALVVRPRDGRDDAIFLPALDGAEAAIASSLREMLDAQHEPGLDVDSALNWFQGRAGFQLAALQVRALRTALTNPVTVITGGPGTGKTTLIRGVVSILETKDRQVLLAAPTGRAAKRLAEATGAPARTIHRLLEFNPTTREFTRNRNNPLEADLVVLDEVSMLDVELAAAFLAAVPRSCRLILVGDADQLPSVGPGNFLRDLIASGSAPVVRLDQVFRQAEQSLIVVNAHRVNSGRMPETSSDASGGDFFFVNRDDPAAAADLVIDFAVRRIPMRFGYRPIEDIQVLSPMHRGELGVARLNERLQELLTPPGPELVVGWRRFRVGDKIMQVRNNYDLDVFNGDLGRISAFDEDEREMIAVFDGRPVTISAENLEDLVPAYACTIHKSQGSEYPAVVIVLHHHHHVMLQRNLLYTAITRGRKLVVIVGSRRALYRAVNNATVRARHTLLGERLANVDPARTKIPR